MTRVYLAGEEFGPRLYSDCWWAFPSRTRWMRPAKAQRRRVEATFRTSTRRRSFAPQRLSISLAISAGPKVSSGALLFRTWAISGLRPVFGPGSKPASGAAPGLWRATNSPATVAAA